MSLLRSASLVLPSCLAGLMATITMPARIAMIATTNSISSSVNAVFLLDERRVKPLWEYLRVILDIDIDDIYKVYVRLICI